MADRLLKKSICCVLVFRSLSTYFLMYASIALKTAALHLELFEQPAIRTVFRQPARLSFIFILMVMLAGCGGQVKLSLSAAKTLNLDESAGALPVIVRVYQLSGKEKIENADFNSLWKSDQQVLEGDLLDRQEVTVYPDTVTEIMVETKKKPNYLAVMALFNKPQGNTWRQIISLKDTGASKIEIALRERSIKILKIK